tara:strand:+ start:121 stop:309 length:189 start_codon:yes stop_codon:yes gene_type:complete
MIEDLWDVSQVAKIFKVSNRTIQKQFENGSLPGIKVGKQIRFSPEAIRRYIENYGRDDNSRS